MKATERSGAADRPKAQGELPEVSDGCDTHAVTSFVSLRVATDLLGCSLVFKLLRWMAAHVCCFAQERYMSCGAVGQRSTGAQQRNFQMKRPAMHYIADKNTLGHTYHLEKP